MANTILNFHFDYLTTSLIYNTYYMYCMLDENIQSGSIAASGCPTTSHPSQTQPTCDVIHVATLLLDKTLEKAQPPIAMVACFHQNSCLQVMSQFGQISAPESRPNFSFKNLDQTSASKSQQNSNFKILTKPRPRYLEQSSASKYLPNCYQHVPHH